MTRDHLDNDKDLNNILANLAWSGKYFDSGQEVLNAFAVKEAKDLIDQYTQSKLKAFAGDAEALLEYEDVERWSDPVDRQVAEECNQLKSNILKALKAIKEKYQL